MELNMKIISASPVNNLVDSLLAFDNDSKNQELVEHLSEHLYIQSQLAMPRIQQLGNIQGMKNFYQSCQKLYCAGDEKSKNEAMDEIRLQMA